MKHLKKIFCLIFIFTALFSTFTFAAACGGFINREDIQDMDPDAGFEDGTYDPDTGEYIPAHIYRIEFFGWGDDSEQRIFGHVIEEFNRNNPRIHVDYSAVASTQFVQALRNRADNLPHVFYMPDTEFGWWARTGRLLNLAPVFESGTWAYGMLDDVWTDAVDKYRFDYDARRVGEGEMLLGVPKDLGPFTMVYNRNLVRYHANRTGMCLEELYEYYLNPNRPMTWAQFNSLLVRLDPRAGQTKTNQDIFGVTHFELEAAVNSNNAAFMNDALTEQRITDPNFAAAVQFIADLHLEHRVMPSPDQQEEMNGFARFQYELAMFSFMGPWDQPTFWGLPFEFDILPVPIGSATGARSTAWRGSMAYSIAGRLASDRRLRPGYQRAALEFALHLTANIDAQRYFYSLGQQVPNLISLTDEFLTNSESLFGNQDFESVLGVSAARANTLRANSVSSPRNRSVFLDIVEGFTDSEDMIGGKSRAASRTPDSLWFTMLEESLEPVFRGNITAAAWAAGHGPTLQNRINQMNVEWN